ncbi:hypothetical protein F2Q70_00030866 [Brassica cretica]|uniref:GST C-terminal domain-containing protein n=1 Tax=Brassica cretica TaxID=69181 RepID=A0A8S9FC60_BRACR|nr:hypothetical protein F2Q70_00030866 [Brassica cretica]
MKKSKLDNSASQTRFGLVQFLLALLLFYFLCMSFEIPFIFRTGSGSDDGLPTQMVVGTMEANRAIVGEEQEETTLHRPFKDPSRVNRAGHIHREFKTVSEIFTNESFFYGGGFADELSTFHETVKHAISTGRKMWGNLDSGLIPKPNPVKTRTEKCPDTVSVTGSEFVNRSRILVLPCGAGMEGYHISVDGRHITSFPYRTIFGSLEAVGGAKDDEGRMAAAGKLMENLAILEEAFQKSSKGLVFFGGENIGFLDLACGTLLGPVSVIEAFSGVKFLRQETTPGLIQWAQKFRAHEAVKPYMPTPEEFVAFAKKKFNVE